MNTNAQTLKEVVYTDRGVQLKGMLSSDRGEKRPGVLILPAWRGIDDEAKTAALNLEKQGYITFIADIYGEGNYPPDDTEAAKISDYYKRDYKAYQHRISLALEELKKTSVLSDKIALIGFCFGGTGALEAARCRLPLRGVVCIHGGLAKAAERKNGEIQTKVLVENPADDRSVSKKDYENLIDEFNEGHADWQIITYAHSKHTFTNPESRDYNETMAKRAWQHTLLFLKEILH